MLGWLLSAVAEGLSSGHERDQKVIISAITRESGKAFCTSKKGSSVLSMSSMMLPERRA